uniref:Arb2 domain-containing protein n=1 Tax=Salvator merianae TaxID=96440 RepID=A0A8D0DL24_SALMN
MYGNCFLLLRYSVMVLNPNDNFIDVKTEPESFSLSEQENSSYPLQPPLVIPKGGSSSPEEHTTYIWDNFISKSAVKNVAFIVHGYGGLVFINLLMQRTAEVMSKVCGVALIDSTHHTMHQTQGNPQVCTWIWKHCQEWVSNSKPLDRPLGYLVKMDCPTVSTGTEKYCLAPSFALQSIFKYLKNTLKTDTKQYFTRSQSATQSKRMMKKN